MDQMKTQILDLPFQAHFISAYNSLQIQCLFHRKLRRKTVHSSFLFPHIKKIYIEASADKSVPVI